MLRSETTLAHAFLSLFSERIIQIPLFTVIRFVHPYQIILGPIHQHIKTSTGSKLRLCTYPGLVLDHSLTAYMSSLSLVGLSEPIC